jgi:hypothetical protein
MNGVLDWIVWLVMKGYVAAFLLGWVAAFQTHIIKNGRQIRRNSETIRRNSEAACRRAYGEASGPRDSAA